ncbi:helix-turn-helix domain-containing protein [Nonomuraea angiospora]
MTNATPPPDDPLSLREVAALFRVDVKTAGRWADIGKLPFFRSPGGRRLYPRAAINALIAGMKPHILAMPDADLQTAGDMLARVLDRGWHGPLTDEEALPLFVLLRALPRGEAQ